MTDRTTAIATLQSKVLTTFLCHNPMATDDRKRQILDHVNRTGGNDFRKISQSAEDRKRRILDHVQRSQGE